MPGINAWFGNEFNRHNTWFSQIDVFLKYLKRCNYMLQQGRYVADVAYFLGEDCPKMTGTRDPEIPAGYSYDYVNAEVLMDATVKDGKLVLKSGMEYKVLVLPRIRTMRPALLAKIRDLVADGMTLLGPAPVQSPSLEDYPAADAKVQEIAAQMWQEATNPFSTSVRFGKGRIYKDASLEQVLRGTAPDFVADDPALPLQFIHLTHSDSEVYFVSNQGDKEISFDGSFRVEGMVPELWNPLSCEVRYLPEFKALTMVTKVPLKLQPYESSFIVFRTPAGNEALSGENYPGKNVVARLDTPWSVEFQEGRGGPEGTVTFTSLTDWTASEDTGIKYFSGTATYTNSFNLKKLPAEKAYIDLGKVMVMAKGEDPA